MVNTIFEEKNMYKNIIRPLLFKLQPEVVHHIVVNSIKISSYLPGVSWLMKRIFNIKDQKLECEFLGMKFKNPIGFAAGFDKNAEVYNEFAAFGFSFVEIGTVTPKPQLGNPKPRSFRIPKDKGLINRMGFNNKGVDKVVEMLKKNPPHIIIGGNIGKNTATPNEKALDDYIYCFKKLYNYVNYFVVNVSCPNIKDLKKLQDKGSLTEILNKLVEQRTKYELKKPILLKISPDLNNDQLDEVIEIYNETNIDGIVATNTTTTRDNLITQKEEIDKIGNGGMSGLPLAARSTEIIRYIYDKSKGEIPIIGVGGIMTTEDAIEKLNAGASLIQLYSGFIYEGPFFVKKINKAILQKKK